MTTSEVDALLSSAADSPDEYQRQGNVFELTRSGTEFPGELINRSELGVLVKEPSGEQTELLVYLQKRLFRLDFLASQILKRLTEFEKGRVVPFIDSPAEITKPGRKPELVGEVYSHIRAEMLSTEFGATKLVTLMAPAGQGKTVLIQKTAIESVIEYSPTSNPMPIVLPVDLLGRNVGNIDDAIAGSLNNTYSVPLLRQRDVLTCLKRGWLALALDGFDELVARVGVSDAFTHVSNLVDDLEGAGIVLLSGRKSFFDTFEILQALGRFLRPIDGSYSTVGVQLLPWQETQALQVFDKLGFSDSKGEIDSLLKQFSGDTTIVFHPFFLTQLAKTMKEGFTVASSVGNDSLGRAKWVIETFLRRELGKWTTKAGQEILNIEQHIVMLGGVSEEMLVTGSFVLKPEELRLAALVGLSHLRLPSNLTDEVSSRITTHAAFLSSNGTFGFFHEQLRHFALGHRIAFYIANLQVTELKRMFSHRTLVPDVVNWADWFYRNGGGDIGDSIEILNSAVSVQTAATILNENLALVAAALASRNEFEMTLLDQRFFGDALLEREYTGIKFERCSFWQVNLDGSSFKNCLFNGCEFGATRCGHTTRFCGSIFSEDCSFEGIQIGEASAYSFTEIKAVIESLGGDLKTVVQPASLSSRRIGEETIKAVEKLVRASNITCDVSGADFADWYPNVAHDIIRAGLKTGVLKEVQKQSSGPSKSFFRIQVDKQSLLSARAKPAEGDPVGDFWEALSE
jgi:uncharacterized protein YjbI with pentapeptide repeats